MICISVSPESRTLAKVDLLNAAARCDVVELGLDHLIKEPNVGELMEGIPKPMLVSCRNKEQGGFWEGTEAERITWAVENVRGVHNEMAVAGVSSYTVRSNDALITTKVKARFLDAQKFNPLHVKVVTENSIVYLMGLVRKQEANDATDIARTTSGVQKVVRVFEYLD